MESPNVRQFQTELIRSIVDESLQSFREVIHQDIQNLHLELLRQFQMQQVSFCLMDINLTFFTKLELASLLEKYANTKELLNEIDALRKENYKLKNLH